MTKDELLSKVEQALLGQPTNNNYKLGELVCDKCNEWFDNTKGYYGIRINAFTITITYKGRGLFAFTCKRHLGLVSQIVSENWFTTATDTETREKEIDDIVLKDAQNERFTYDFYNTTATECARVLHSVKEVLKGRKANEIRRILQLLQEEYFEINELDERGN